MNILRFENWNSCGPYQVNNIYEWALRDHSDNPNTPSAITDIELNNFIEDNDIDISDYIFGFETKQMFMNWFSYYEEICKLYALGYSVFLYKNVDIWFSSEYQTIFSRHAVYNKINFHSVNVLTNYLTSMR